MVELYCYLWSGTIQIQELGNFEVTDYEIYVRFDLITTGSRIILVNNFQTKCHLGHPESP